MKYRALCTIVRDGHRHRADSEVELPDETAEGLLRRSPPAIARISAPVVSATPSALPKDSPRDAPRVNAKTTIERIKSAGQVGELLTLRDAEEAHADGARKTVLEAIDAQLDVLAADTGDDADADKDLDDDEELGEGDEG